MNSLIASKSRRVLLSFVALVVVAAVIVGVYLSSAKPEITAYNVDSDLVAIHGYDTVAYFTDGKPTKGKIDFEHVWQEAHWQFASATNRDLFATNPDRYAPQFGGYCSAGVALGEYADVDPEAWTIVDGKLYLISTKENREVWQKSPEAHIGYAKYNWEKNRAQFRNNL